MYPMFLSGWVAFIWHYLPAANTPTVPRPLMFNSGSPRLCLRLSSSPGFFFLPNVVQYHAGFVYAPATSLLQVEPDRCCVQGITEWCPSSPPPPKKKQITKNPEWVYCKESNQQQRSGPSRFLNWDSSSRLFLLSVLLSLCAVIKDEMFLY